MTADTVFSGNTTIFARWRANNTGGGGGSGGSSITTITDATSTQPLQPGSGGGSSGGGGSGSGSLGSTSQQQPQPQSETPVANISSEFTTADAIYILRYVAGIIELTPEQIAKYDLDGDGEITTEDAVMILRIVAGLSNCIKHILKTKDYIPTAATCTEGSGWVYYCSNCNETSYEIPKLGHDYNSPYTSIICTRSICGFVNGTPEISTNPPLRYMFRGEKLATTVPNPTGHFGAARSNNKTHSGIDITYCFSLYQGIKDMTVYSVSNGEVTRSEYTTALGNVIGITDGDRRYVYMHLNSRAVSRLETVTQNCPLGTVGDTGTSSNGYHLHFEIYVSNVLQDPFNFYPSGMFRREWWNP